MLYLGRETAPRKTYDFCISGGAGLMGSVQLDPLRRRGSHFIYPAGRCPAMGPPLPPRLARPHLPSGPGGYPNGNQYVFRHSSGAARARWS